MRAISPIRDFFHRESAGGIVLIAAAIAGLAIANSPLSAQYFSILEWKFSIGTEAIYLKLTTAKIINYLLMSVFFFIVGLEIKRELTAGHLASIRRALAPFIAAIGGMAIPAVLYLAIAGGTAPHGWGVPVATDIALAVGLLGLMGTAVTPALRTFLLGLAVIDDIGAILIIAFIYSTGVKISWIIAATAATVVLALLFRLKVKKAWLYLAVVALLWYGLYRSGVHPTLSGVIAGLMTPGWTMTSSELVDEEDGEITIIDWLIDRIHPWSSFLIVPLFAFANTGVKISGESISQAMQSPIAWGIFAGLVLGKPLGILLSLGAAVAGKAAEYPTGSTPVQVLATGSAAGIGFTVAIFIADLAFTSSAEQDSAILAVIVASLISAMLSVLLFRLSKK